MKIQIKGFVVYRKDEQFGDYRIYPYENSYEGAITLGPCKVEVDIPDDFNPIPLQVAALEQSKRELKAAFAKKLMEIENSISKLTCITNEVEA